jgi:hypothetical protein
MDNDATSPALRATGERLFNTTVSLDRETREEARASAGHSDHKDPADRGKFNRAGVIRGGVRGRADVPGTFPWPEVAGDAGAPGYPPRGRWEILLAALRTQGSVLAKFPRLNTFKSHAEDLPQARRRLACRSRRASGTSAPLNSFGRPLGQLRRERIPPRPSPPRQATVANPPGARARSLALTGPSFEEREQFVNGRQLRTSTGAERPTACGGQRSGEPTTLWERSASPVFRRGRI